MIEKSLVKIDQFEKLTSQMEQDIRKAANVSPNPKIDDVGRLTGEALAMSYEAAAKQVEEMGRHLVEEVKSCEQSSLDVVRELDRFRETTSKAIEDCKRTAEEYRKEAAHLSAHVKDRVAAADDVRRLCEEMIAKIRIPTTQSPS
jgi:hypothetical protein